MIRFPLSSAMRTNFLLFAIATASVLPVSAQDLAEGQALQMRDAATHDQLSQSLRMAQQNDPIRNIGPAIGQVEEDPSLALAGRDLVKDSIILCFRGNLTLLPKRSVLHLPESLKSRFEAADDAAVVPWATFLQNNRGWIRTLEVSREQAMGEAPLPAEARAAFETSTSVIVATFQGGPISVKPYVQPEIAPTQSDETSSTAAP